MYRLTILKYEEVGNKTNFEQLHIFSESKCIGKSPEKIHSKLTKVVTSGDEDWIGDEGKVRPSVLFIIFNF